MEKSGARDIIYIGKIIRHIKTLDEAFSVFSIKSADDLRDSDICSLAVAQIITNIHELKGKLREEALQRVPHFNRLSLRAARNIASHDYDSLDFDIVYKRCMQILDAGILAELEVACDDIRGDDSLHQGG